MITAKNLDKETKKIFLKIEKEVFKFHSQKNFFDVELLVVDPNTIKEENKKLREVDEETDVLSIPYFDNIKFPCEKKYFKKYDFNKNKILLGSILICLEVAKKQANEYGHTLQRELGFLFCHSMLHLLGYDHLNESEEKRMFEIQDLILERVGLRR